MHPAVSAKGPQLAALPAGVTRRPLKTHPDNRGEFTELFRNEWQDSPPPIQWNLSRSNPNVLRGVQVHARHWDYFCVLEGELLVGLHDMRPEFGKRPSTLVELSSRRLEVMAIPPGVAHSLYSPTHSAHLTGVSQYHDPTDHARCRWDCPELGLDWPCEMPEVSSVDRDAPGYAEFEANYRAMAARARE